MKRFVLALFIVLLTGPMGNAATISFSGQAGSWNASGNWDLNRTPVWGDDVAVTFGVGPTFVDADVSVESLRVGGTNRLNISTHKVTLNSLYPAGTLDTTTFNPSGTYHGMVITNLDPQMSEANAVVVQADQKIVVAGYAYNYGSSKCALARYNTDGTLDTSFGDSGKVLTTVGNSCEAKAVAIQPDQKIVIAGYSNDGSGNNRFMAARYTTNGELDTTGFNSSGEVPGAVITQVGAGTASPYNSKANAVAIQSDGKIVVAGYAVYYGLEDFAVVRYTTAGALDTDFYTIGILRHSFGDSHARALALTIQPADQKIVVAGYSYNLTKSRFTIMRLLTTGEMDTAFNTSGAPRGMVATAIGSENSSAQAVAMQADGKIVAVGYSLNGSHYDFTVARYTTAGVLDSTFHPAGSPAGTVATSIGSQESQASAVVIQPGDQRIVVAGYGYDGVTPQSAFALVRYSVDGDLDTTFGTAGQVITVVGDGTGGSTLYGLALQSDGKIVATGYNHSTAGGSIFSFATLRYWP